MKLLVIDESFAVNADQIVDIYCMDDDLIIAATMATGADVIVVELNWDYEGVTTKIINRTYTTIIEQLANPGETLVYVDEIIKRIVEEEGEKSDDF